MKRKAAAWIGVLCMSLVSTVIPIYAKDETVTLNLEISDTEVRAGDEVVLTVLLQDCSPNLASFNLEVFYDPEKFIIGEPDTSGRPAGGIPSDNKKPTGSFYMSAMYSPDLTEVEDRKLLIIPFQAKEDVSGTANFWIDEVAFGFNYGMDSVNEPKGNYAEGVQVQIASGISQIVITDLEAPVKNQVPDTQASVSDHVIITSIVWTPEAETFASDTAYTVTISYELEEGYTLTEDAAASINGEKVELDQEKGQIRYTFPKTEGKTLAEIVFADPDKKEYDGKEVSLAEVFSEAVCEQGKVVYQYNGKQYESLSELKETVADSGIYTVKAIYEDKDYYGEASASFEITKRKTDVIWEEKTFVYNGEEQAPAAFYQTVEGNQKELEVTGKKSEAGEDYIAEIISFEDKNYYLNDETRKKKFTIEKATLTGTLIFQKITSSRKKLRDVVVDTKDIQPAGGKLIWDMDSSTRIERGKSYSWRYIINDNYTELTGTVVLWTSDTYDIVDTDDDDDDDDDDNGDWQSELYQVDAMVRRVIGFDTKVIDMKKSAEGNLIITSNGSIVFQKKNSTLAKNEWKWVENQWYYFDADFFARAGWYCNPIGKWYYLDLESRQMQTGWKFINQKWYYLDLTNGDMKTGWLFVGNKWYYLDRINGDMKTGWQWIENKWYYFAASGEMQTGWQQIGNKWYYLTADGDCLLDTITPDGYKVDPNGVWIP